MRLLRVELHDFRPHAHGVLDLHGPDGKPVEVMALVGRNGTGKSAWLDAIVGFFSALVPAYGGTALSTSDVRDGKALSDVQVIWRDSPEFPGDMSRTLVVVKSATSWRGQSLLEGVHEPIPEAGRAIEWAKRVGSPTRLPLGVIVYLDTHRFMPPLTVAGPDVSRVAKHRAGNALAPSIRRDATMWFRFGHLRQWIVNLEFLRARAKADRNEVLPAWEHLVAALNRLLTPYRFERVSEDFEVLFHTPTGVVSIERLSSGFQSVLIIITELLLRLSLAVDDASKVFDVEAVCLIDEIDAHLHPEWQERIVDELRWLFPRVQFIVTTHSPLVVASLAPHEFSLLREVEVPDGSD